MPRNLPLRSDATCHDARIYGILPKDLAPDVPIDPYATDQAYWRAFQLRPATIATD